MKTYEDDEFERIEHENQMRGQQMSAQGLSEEWKHNEKTD